MMTHDPVNHPEHYTAHPSGVECITITRHMNFNIGNAVKYLWRAGLKGATLEDLKKAAWYINNEIARIEKQEADDRQGELPLTIRPECTDDSNVPGCFAAPERMRGIWKDPCLSCPVREGCFAQYNSRMR